MLKYFCELIFDDAIFENKQADMLIVYEIFVEKFILLALPTNVFEYNA